MNGIGFAALIVLLLVGIPWAMWFDAKKKPGAVTPGRNETTIEQFIQEEV